MLTILHIELIKIFSKWRSYIGFIAVGILVPIIQVAMYSEGEQYFALFTQSLRQMFDFSGDLTNGYLIAFIVLNSLFVHIPLLISLVAGDMLAGEATAGTYRMILTRPVSRFSVVTAKFFAALIYVNALILWMSVLSLGLSVIFFGKGELLIIGSKITILQESDILWRFGLSYMYASLSMTTVASLAFLFSALVENAIGPIVGTMAIIIVFTIISSLDAESLDAVRPLFFTNHLVGWRMIFDNPPETSRIVMSAVILAGHCIVFYIASLGIMLKKDILT